MNSFVNKSLFISRYGIRNLVLNGYDTIPVPVSVKCLSDTFHARAREIPV